MCNTPSPRAVFETIIRSMAKLGVPLESARELYQRLPISGMAYFMERFAPPCSTELTRCFGQSLVAVQKDPDSPSRNRSIAASESYGSYHLSEAQARVSG